MQKASSALSVLPASKTEVILFAHKLNQEMHNGEVNPLDLRIYKKCIDETFKIIKDTLDEYSREEAEKYGTKIFSFKGVKIELAEHGTTYDFAKCNDPVLLKLEAEFQLADKALKDRQTFLKGIKGSVEIVNEDDGEVHTVLPPVKRSTSGIKCELV